MLVIVINKILYSIIVVAMRQILKILILCMFFLPILVPTYLCDAANNLELKKNMKYSYSYELTLGDFSTSIDLFITDSNDTLLKGITVVSVSSLDNISTRIYRFKILKDEKKFYETSYLKEKEIYSEDVHFTELTSVASQSSVSLIFNVAMIEKFYDFNLSGLISEKTITTNWSGVEANVSFDGEMEYNGYNVYKITVSSDMGLFGTGSSTYYIDTVFPYTLVALLTDIEDVENYSTINLESAEEKLFNPSDYDIEYAPNNNPRALFNYTVNNNGVVEFDASEAYDKDGNIISYYWDFGDGANDTDITTSHKYNEDGKYTVKLYVTDDEGAKGFSSKVIDIELSSNGGKNAEGTPGFELLFLILAATIVVVWMKKRK